jgi:hypothetical protein
LHIQSTEAISVYALNQKKYTTDATNILPTNTLGKDYYQLSYSTFNSAYKDGYLVVATEDNAKIYEGDTITGTLKATLQKGGVYSNYVSDNATGMHITSTKPVAYFVANECAEIPKTIASADYLYQQMEPVNTWGKTFFVPVTTQGKERVRVLASENGTNITASNGTIKIGTGGQNSLSSLNAGKFVELEITGGCYISSNKPIAVCAYLLANQEINTPVFDVTGDPSIAWVPPVGQFVTNTLIASFETTENTVINKHYALIIANTANRDLTTVAIGGGAPVSLTGTWTTGSGTGAGYSFYSLKLDQPNSSYTLSNPDGLMVMGYGLGDAESYYYTAGSGMYDLSNGFFVNDIYYEDVIGKIFCDGEVQLRTATDYSTSGTIPPLQWVIDGSIDFDGDNQWNWTKTLTPGPHSVKLIVNNKDANAVITNFIIETIPVSISDVAIDQPCGSVTTGTITITAAGGSDIGYEYSIDDGQTWQGSNVFSGMGKGIYHIAVRSVCTMAKRDVEINNCQLLMPVNPGVFFIK